MSQTLEKSKSLRSKWLIVALVLACIAVGGWATKNRWLPHLSAALRNESQKGAAAPHEVSHAESGHGHEHAGHSENASIQLSANALKNIGFQPFTVQMGSFERTITLPAIVVEQPGRTQIHISSPLTGVVTKISAMQGEAVEPDSPMFEIRLTHEDIVTAQRDFLVTAENLDVVDREIARLKGVGEGVIAGKRIVEQEYEKQKLEAALLASQQALLLHGLSAQQVAEIRKTKKLLQTLTIYAPAHSRAGELCSDHLFHVQHLGVSQGQQVSAGQELCILADHCELFIEGRAFEDDAKKLRDAAEQRWDITAVQLSGAETKETIKGLKLLYLADQVDPDSRAFHFYIRLPNEVVLNQTDESGRRYIQWHFKPGQRMELRVPVERWKDRIILPVDAVIDEGAENYVYRQNGNHFDRVPVHVEYRDRDSVVVANNGSLFPGDVVAGKGAYQIHLALKNKSGGGIDPHAGHHH
jgi:multidrug efflux pump subunit AcrA (membrane-fusion protein)